MSKSTSIFIAVLIFFTTMIVDPFAYASFTAPKHYLFILLAPLFFAVALWKTEKWFFGLIPFLFLLRIGWLAIINPEWVLHPGNDSFYLFLGLLWLLLAVRQIPANNIHTYYFGMLFLIGIMETAIGLWQLSIYIPDPTAPMKTAMVGTLGTSNGLGLLLVFSVIAGVFLMLKSSMKWTKMGVAVGLLFVLIGILLTESRGAVLALVIAGLVTGLMSLKASEQRFVLHLKRYKALVFSVMVLILTITGYGLYSIDRESSQGRLMMWEITWEMIRDEPITGIGQGKYSVEYLNYQADFFTDSTHNHLQHKAANIKQAHNEFLQAFAEGGIPGGVLFCLIWVLPLIFAVRKFMRNKAICWDLLAITAIHIAIIIHSMVDSPLHVLPIAVIGYINMTLIPIPSKEVSFSIVTKYLTITALVIYIGLIVYRAYVKYPAQHDWMKGVELAERKEWEPAITYYNNALDRFKKKGELEHHLGSAMVFNGQYSRGIHYLKQATKDFNDRNIYLSKSYAYLQLHQYEEAEQLAKRALRMFPDQLAPHLLLGEIYYNKEEIELSKASLKKCIYMDTNITSPEVEQISRDAKEFWISKYGKLP